MSKRITFLMLLMVAISVYTYGQDGSLKLGIRIGGGMSTNHGIGDILVSENYYSNYTFSDKWQVVPMAAVVVQYHKPNSLFGVEGCISYWQRATKLEYSDNVGLHYEVTPRYSHLGITAMLKCYPWRKGFNITVGGRIGAVLNDKGLTYESNQENEEFARYGFATVGETERLMKEKLTGRPDISLGGGLGYEIGNHWAVDIRYYYGTSSTIKTEVNDFNWVEKDTHSHNIELSATYYFNL